ncbi:MAG: sugar phosphate nucleotidyltransferase [Archangium sp.]|nr:sugar phosphate nucleotidyltransferase [Archangium sp.]
MRAIVLAGGKGTRLAPYTTVLPKPLMPIGDVPILEVVLRQLAHHRFTDVSLAVGYLAELLMAYCGDGSKFGVRLDYSREAAPLGTAGPIALVSDLKETFMVMNGDLLTTIDYSKMLTAHREAGALVTVASYEKTVKIDLGVLELSAANEITDYIEKPTMKYAVSMGIYLFEPRVLSYIEKGVRLDLPDLVKRLMAAKEKVLAYRHAGYWLDIGRHDDYQEAVREFEAHRSEFLPAS